METFVIIDTECYERFDRIKKFFGIKKISAKIYSFEKEDRVAVHVLMPYWNNIKTSQIEKDFKKIVSQYDLKESDKALLTVNAKNNIDEKIFKKYLNFPDGRNVYLKLLPQAIKRIIKQSNLDILDFTVLIYERDISHKTIEIFSGIAILKTPRSG